MAESRLEKLGTIFTRVQNLLRSGAIRESQKPIWYDVYAAFPPLREPTYRNIRPLVGKIKDTVPPILYPEDQIRAKFYEVYGAGSGIFELARSNYKSPCQRFVEKYNELKNKEGEMDEDLLFAETGKALLAEGLVLSRKGKKISFVDAFYQGGSILCLPYSTCHQFFLLCNQSISISVLLLS
ncbi:28S ribosomal protein S23, mitochondrial isoform X3 [Crotalus tigris]|uniref:28S ribosomal protein S23, mitochondrial isoform X3 n=1 Tax=Crotalus tigris TaxID=88082 RepID=UPI00192F37C1|nr:28S ribosomal protein S23, mitochondrial isoform X3 [Crotalus tigris]